MTTEQRSIRSGLLRVSGRRGGTRYCSRHATTTWSPPSMNVLGTAEVIDRCH